MGGALKKKHPLKMTNPQVREKMGSKEMPETPLLPANPDRSFNNIESSKRQF